MANNWYLASVLNAFSYTCYKHIVASLPFWESLLIANEINTNMCLVPFKLFIVRTILYGTIYNLSHVAIITTITTRSLFFSQLNIICNETITNWEKIWINGKYAFWQSYGSLHFLKCFKKQENFHYIKDVFLCKQNKKTCKIPV